MTEGQRDYLADLANRRGVRLENTDNRSAAWASAKIEELKALPNKQLYDWPELTADQSDKIRQETDNVKEEILKWNFQA